MKLALAALAFCPALFAQAAPEIHLLDNLNPNPGFITSLKSLKLLDSKNPLTFLYVAPKAKACAIPLAQALRPGDRTDYKMRIVKPNLPEAQLAATSPRIGADPCR
jgi:hypothetical protein